MTEKAEKEKSIEDSFFGEDDLFKEKIFKKSDFVEDIELEDLEESE